MGPGNFSSCMLKFNAINWLLRSGGIVQKAIPGQGLRDNSRRGGLSSQAMLWQNILSVITNTPGPCLIAPTTHALRDCARDKILRYCLPPGCRLHCPGRMALLTPVDFTHVAAVKCDLKICAARVAHIANPRARITVIARCELRACRGLRESMITVGHLLFGAFPLPPDEPTYCATHGDTTDSCQGKHDFTALAKPIAIFTASTVIASTTGSTTASSASTAASQLPSLQAGICSRENHIEEEQRKAKPRMHRRQSKARSFTCTGHPEAQSVISSTTRQE